MGFKARVAEQVLIDEIEEEERLASIQGSKITIAEPITK